MALLKVRGSSKLTPTCNQKSFYGKAHVYICGEGDGKDRVIVLKSYNTIVAAYDENSDMFYIRGYFSPTTGRHIKSFVDHMVNVGASGNGLPKGKTWKAILEKASSVKFDWDKVKDAIVKVDEGRVF